MRISQENQVASLKLVISSAKLKAQLPTGTALALTELISGVNCYYSNVIEGIQIKLPKETLREAILAEHSPGDEEGAYLAHLAVQGYLEDQTGGGQHPFQDDIIRAAYSQLISLSPLDQLGQAALSPLHAGGYRAHGVRVGAHIAPAPDAVAGLMLEFENEMGSTLRQHPHAYQRLPIIALAHHRLAWIHPFMDGNGRLIRLVNDAALHGAGIEGYELWSCSRGLARHRQQYYEHLAAMDRYMDAPATHDQILQRYLGFWIGMCQSQVDFMTERFSHRTLEHFNRSLFSYLHSEIKVPQEAAIIYWIALRVGEVSKKLAVQLTGKSERWTRDLLKRMQSLGLLISQESRHVLQPRIPPWASMWLISSLLPLRL